MCPNTSQKYIKCFRRWGPTLVQLMWQTISRIVYATQFETGTSVAYCNFLKRCRKLIQCTFQSEMHAILPCRKNKRRYLLTLQVSKYCHFDFAEKNICIISKLPTSFFKRIGYFWSPCKYRRPSCSTIIINTLKHLLSSK